MALLIAGAQSFFAEGKIPGGVKPAVFQQSWEGLISSGTGYVFGAFVDGLIPGALGFVISNDPSNGDKVGTEMFWYIQPEHRGHGLRLLKAYEAFCKEQGCVRISMVHLIGLFPEALKKVYERFGYKPVEVNYLKAL